MSSTPTIQRRDRSCTARPRAAALALLAFAAPLLLLAGCDERDMTSVRIRLSDERAGTVRIASLQPGDGSSPLRQGSAGVDWQAAVTVEIAGGAFTDIASLKLHDITFASASAGGSNLLTVTLPRGSAAAWAGAIAITDDGVRTSAAAVLDPDGEVPKAGKAYQFSIVVPGDVLTSGHDCPGAGIKAGSSDNTATLSVPVSAVMTATSGGEPIVWNVTWR